MSPPKPAVTPGVTNKGGPKEAKRKQKGARREPKGAKREPKEW